MKRALMVATVFKFLNFEKSDIEILQSMGYEVHTATNMHEAKWLQDDGTFKDSPIIRHQIDFGRSPFSKDNIKAYKQLKKLLSEYQFELIHCHTPVAAAITRIAAIKTRRKGTKVVYTSHGFHFHKSSSKKDWILYYSMEWLLAFLTDMIITINHEDYNVARKLKAKECRYIPGVGIDVQKIRNMEVDREGLRKEIGVPSNAFLLLAIGELSARKNQSVIIKALKKLNNTNIYLAICGTGEKRFEYEQLIKQYGLEKQVRLLGQREHIWVMKLCHICDVGVLPSTIEGLGLAGLEIMAAGKPVIGSNVHGIKDFVKDNLTGYSCAPNDIDGFAKAIDQFMKNEKLYRLCAINAKKMAEHFDIKRTRELMIENYEYITKEIKHDFHT